MATDAGTPVPEQGPAAAGVPAVRASDDERHHVAELLGDHAAAGRITLAELEERVGRAYAAVTRAELDELTRDLPSSSMDAAGELTTTPPTRKRNRWFFAIMGGSTWRGKRRLAGRINVLSIMGGDDLDLREAEIEGSELIINTISIMGGPNIYLPDTVDVEFSGTAIMGGNDERGSQRPARAGAPLIRIRSFALMGGIELWRLPAESRGKSLREAKRDAKAIERGQG